MTAAAWAWRDGLRYGALGAPLAFVALPLYVLLPSHYASQFGVSLAALGAVLLAVRGLDAVVDPWIGRWIDRAFGRPKAALLRTAGVAAVACAAGFAALFFPLPALLDQPDALLGWCAATLVLTYFGYSVLGVLHQAWGARLGGDEAMRARIVGWREGLALAGVLAASVLPSLLGLGVTAAVFAAGLALGLWALAHAPFGRQARATAAAGWGLPWRDTGFQRLLGVYLCNGIASAVPATLVLFFIRDRLQAPQAEPLFLAGYFLAGALSMPLWVRLVARVGLLRTWLAGMALAVGSFVWAYGLGAGDVTAFALVCLASGAALGADLTVPAALLAGVIRRAGHAEQAEGVYFGWWNSATKLNLALAAGLALPALQWLGYQPGSRDAQALQALSGAYCLLPCALKLAAAALLWRERQRWTE